MAKTKEKPKKGSKKGDTGTEPAATSAKNNKTKGPDKRSGAVTPKGTKGWDPKSTKKDANDVIVDNALAAIKDGKNKGFMADVAGLLKGIAPQLDYALRKNAKK